MSFGTCATCQFSKAYADPRASKRGVMLFCTFNKKGTHVNGVCDEYTGDAERVSKEMRGQLHAHAKCATCSYTMFAHALRGMRDKTCDDFVFPALAKQDELFPVEAVERKTVSTMRA